MQPAKVHIRAKNSDLWDSVKPFIEYLMKKTKLRSKIESQCGMLLELDAQEAEFLHYLISHHKLPIIVEIEIQALM